MRKAERVSLFLFFVSIVGVFVVALLLRTSTDEVEDIATKPDIRVSVEAAAARIQQIIETETPDTGVPKIEANLDALARQYPGCRFGVFSIEDDPAIIADVESKLISRSGGLVVFRPTLVVEGRKETLTLVLAWVCGVTS